MKMTQEIFQRFLSKIAFFAPGGSNFRPWLQRLRGVKVGQNVWLSQYVYLDELYPEKITIGDNSTIGLRVSIFTHFHWGGKRSETYSNFVTIGKDVFIGPHCVILPNVHIGDGCVIRAGSVVSKNVPDYTYLGFNADEAIAQVTVPLTREHTYSEFVYGLRPIRKKSQPK